ncbi:MAG TPA: hypothetical protein VHO50_13935 [Bacteroidales bacterium]|nr:hypothetical protein [Bacteroidales bacterium]
MKTELIMIFLFIEIIVTIIAGIVYSFQKYSKQQTGSYNRILITYTIVRES